MWFKKSYIPIILDNPWHGSAESSIFRKPLNKTLKWCVKTVSSVMQSKKKGKKTILIVVDIYPSVFKIYIFLLGEEQSYSDIVC